MIVQPIGIINTGVPLVVLMAGALVVPRLVLDATTLSHRVLARGVLLSALILMVLGAGMLAVIYQWRGSDVTGAFAADPVATLDELFRVSAKASLFWVPVLALVWFAQAQGVERRRGEARARL